jgi:phosphoglycerol transferase MdoB-like AlkP superfamily enzyme
VTRGARRLVWIGASFLIVSVVTRVGLALWSDGRYTITEWGRFMGIGALFDLAVLPWLLLPWAVYDALTPAFRRPSLSLLEGLWAATWGFLYLTFFIVVAVAEFAFWGEFSSRFDFIAVDYLVYTNEVFGNIRESYPIGQWLGAIAAAALVVAIASWPRSRMAAAGPWLRRWVLAGVVAGIACISFAWTPQNMADRQRNAYVQQLSANGLMAFVHAYVNNELDYERYYPTLPAGDLDAEIRRLLKEPNTRFIAANGIDREVQGVHALRKVNVVLISVESLSADFLGHFGNTQGLTPELDRLADEGLLFTRMYATGTRTVRGLEALSIGTPPTPGQSIVRRPNNDGLENIGEELEEEGWEPYWIYGGYGFFDNMNAYFRANHYTVADRSDIEAEGLPIHHENIWGVSDEDLYSLALAKLDRTHEAGKPFFAHIMTTSNHRPYTFPENRIDLPQKKREGAVKYTDWAIGDFIRRSATKPWFANTLFIITADHTSKAAGRSELPPDRYHIPMIWYAPGLIEPGLVNRLTSQIDVSPTLMGWLGLSYDSRFFGYDLFHLEPGRERAFISTYQKLGYLKGDRLVVLDVNRKPVVGPGVPADPGAPPAPPDDQLIAEATAWYQSASRMFGAGLLKDMPEISSRRKND